MGVSVIDRKQPFELLNAWCETESMSVANVRRVPPLRLVCLVLVSAVGVCSSADAQRVTPESLYARLGGLAPISVIVSDLMDALAPDPVLNENQAVAAARARVPAAYIKYQITAQICEAAGGPCEYVGRSMRDSHAHLNITETEWDRMITTLREVLEKHMVPAQERQELLDIFESTKADIVL